MDLNGEGQGIIFNLEKVGNVELSTTAFGQGVSVTPIQQVTAVSAVVNGGYLYKPYIVKNISEGETNTIIKENNKSLVRKVISSKTSSIMRHALESVVAKGGGKSAYIEGYRIGGKTGTAQKVQDGKYLVGNYIMSFMAVVPSNDPEAVLYLAIDNPKNTALLSSYTTTPIARRILLDIIDALGIEKQEDELNKFRKKEKVNIDFIEFIIKFCDSEEFSNKNKFERLRHNYYKIKNDLLEIKNDILSKRIDNYSSELNTNNQKLNGLENKFEGIGATVISITVAPGKPTLGQKAAL